MLVVTVTTHVSVIIRHMFLLHVLWKVYLLTSIVTKPNRCRLLTSPQAGVECYLWLELEKEGAG